MSKSKQNCNAEKVLSFVAPSGEQELTENYSQHLLICCFFVVYMCQKRQK